MKNLFSAVFTQSVSFNGGFAALGMSDSVEGWENKTQNAIAAGIVGGTASVIGGGKFANGAMSGAMSRLLNDCAHGYCSSNDTQEVNGKDAVTSWASDTEAGSTTRMVIRADGVSQSYDGWMTEQLYGANSDMSYASCGPLDVAVCAGSVLIGGDIPSSLQTDAHKVMGVIDNVASGAEFFDIPYVSDVVGKINDAFNLPYAVDICKAACDAYNRRLGVQ